MTNRYINGTLHFPRYDDVADEDVESLFNTIRDFSADIVKQGTDDNAPLAKLYATRQLSSIRKALRKMLKDEHFEPNDKWLETLMCAHGRAYISKCVKILKGVSPDGYEDAIKEMLSLVSQLQLAISSVRGRGSGKDKGAAK